MTKRPAPSGFTLVELMITMAVMAVLSTLGLFGYGQIVNESKNDLNVLQIMKAARMTRVQQDKVLGLITSYCSACSCWGACNYTCDACKTTMDVMFQRIGLPGALKDPWGYYYSIDENEGERAPPNDCIPDYIYSKGGAKWKPLPLYSSQCGGGP